MRHSFFLSVVFLLCVTIVSCDDSDEIPDSAGPEIVINSPANDQKVAGIINIEASAQDLSSVTSMQIYIDGALVKEISQSPISAQVDTKSFTDGVHVVEIRARDKSENVSTKKINVVILNTLFTLHVSSNYALDNSEVYFTISKNDGTIMGSGPLKNGQTVTVPTPSAFNLDSTFVYTEYIYHHELGNGGWQYTSRTASSYAGISAGEFALPQFDRTAHSNYGSHHLEISDLPPSYGNLIISGLNVTGASMSTTDNAFAADVYMDDNPSDLLVSTVIGTGDNKIVKYKYIPTIRFNESTSFPSSDLADMQKVSVTLKDATTDQFSSYVGAVLPNPNGAEFLYSGWGSLDQQLLLFYPGETFSSYLFSMEYQKDGSLYGFQEHAAVAPTSFVYVNGDVSNVDYLNKRLKVTSTGSSTILTVSGTTQQSGAGFSTYEHFAVSFPEGVKKQVTIPKLPDAVITLGFSTPDNYNFDDVSMTDYPGISTPADYQKHLVFNSDNISIWYRDYSSTSRKITPTHSGGRISRMDQVNLPRPLQQLWQDHLPMSGSWLAPKE